MWCGTRPTRAPWIGGLLASTLVLNLIDTTLTLSVVTLGLAVEGNPVMAAVLAQSPLAFAVVKIGLVSAGVWVLWRYRSRALAAVGSALAFAAYLGVATYHVRSVQALASLAVGW